jgi:hypothetical protein
MVPDKAGLAEAGFNTRNKDGLNRVPLDRRR